MRIGVYGGSFNPIHLGHTRLSEALLRLGVVDELWLIVSPMNPLKAGRTMLPDEERLRLCRLATEGMSGIRVSDVEMRLPRPSYMVRTLQTLREAHPTEEFSLIIGSDNWTNFHRWYRSDEIMAHHSIIIYPREGHPVNGKELPGNVQIVDTPLIPLSSTQIREAINNDPSYSGEGLDPKVWREIKKKGFFRTSL